MNEKNKNLLQRLFLLPFWKTLLIIIICLSFATIWYLFLFGRHTLYFSNIGWTYNSGGDILKAQIGWEWFRQEPWHFPLGNIESYGYPSGTSLTFLDSILLMAIPLKILSPILGSKFQYLGIWTWISIFGQMLFGMLILGEFSKSWVLKILGASFLVLSPPLIFRSFIHFSLTAQWVILAGIWFLILEYRKKFRHWGWHILFLITMFIHFYFVAMLIPLWIASLFLWWRNEKNKRKILVTALAVPVIIVIAGYVLGFFSIGGKSLAVNGFGYYSWNLNGFLNPFQYSAILNPIKTNPDGGQNEGFSYLGLGGIIFFLWGLVLFLQNENVNKYRKFFIPLLAACFLEVIFALSNVVFLNDQILWAIKLPDWLFNICSMFRSSGRFIWPVFYLMIRFGLINLLRNVRFTTPILIVLIFLQLIDIQPLFFEKKATDFSTYSSPLVSDFWAAAKKTNKQIVLLPVTGTPSILNPLIIYARQSNLLLNWGNFSRIDSENVIQYADNVWNDLAAEEPDNQTLYIFWDESWHSSEIESFSRFMYICKVDNYKLGFSTTNGLVDAGLDLEQFCAIPK
jgi:hypothetical protein